MSDGQRAESDRCLLERLLALQQVRESASLLLYWGVGREPDTRQLLEPLAAMGKQVSLPRCLGGGQMEARQYLGPEHLVTGTYGIPEPDLVCPTVKREYLSLILVPALCCDSRGYRLGHGGGYYDRYLEGFAGRTVALCRDRLLLPALPIEPHDRPVDVVLTETRCLSFF